MNRSQQDIIDQKPIKAAIEREIEFLTKNYPALESRNGSAYLVKTLSYLLMNHIRDCLPEVRKRVNAQLMEFRMKLSSYGETLEPVSRSND